MIPVSQRIQMSARAPKPLADATMRTLLGGPQPCISEVDKQSWDGVLGQFGTRPVSLEDRFVFMSDGSGELGQDGTPLTVYLGNLTIAEVKDVPRSWRTDAPKYSGPLVVANLISTDYVDTPTVPESGAVAIMARPDLHWRFSGSRPIFSRVDYTQKVFNPEPVFEEAPKPRGWRRVFSLGR